MSMFDLNLILFLLLSACFTSNNSYAGTFKQYDLRVKGEVRQYYVYTPSHLSTAQKHPAIMAFHAYESDAQGLRWLISPDKYADKFGYIMVYPSALNKGWNVGKGFGSVNQSTDDYSFFKALPAALVQRHSIDGNKLYAMGFSNGAQAVTTMLCRMPEKIAAAAIVAHTMNIDHCNPSIKVPTVVIHGKKDRMAPFNGGGKHNLSSYDETVRFLRTLNEIQHQGRRVVEKATVRCTQYKDTHSPIEVQGCVCLDAGHSWPQGKTLMVDTLGQVNKELDANQFIFDFFSRHEHKHSVRSNTGIIRSGRINASVLERHVNDSEGFARHYSRGGILLGN